MTCACACAFEFAFACACSSAPILYFTLTKALGGSFVIGSLLGQTPFIRLLVSIVQWDNLFLLLALAHGSRIDGLEEGWRDADEPFRVDCGYFAHVLFCRHDELVVENPFRGTRIQGRGRMQVNLLVVNNCAVAIVVRILPGHVSEESCAECRSNAIPVFAAGLDWLPVSVHDAEELATNILSSLQAAHLDKVLVAPLWGEVMLRPGLPNGQQR